MPGGQGLRHRTRDLFQRGFRQKGFIPLTTYLRTYKLGDYVDIKMNPAQQKVWTSADQQAAAGARRHNSSHPPQQQHAPHLPALQSLGVCCGSCYSFQHACTQIRSAHGEQAKTEASAGVGFAACAAQGMAFKWYHGKTGVVWNVTKRAVGVEVNKQVRVC